jgi:hypothetical protein
MNPLFWSVTFAIAILLLFIVGVTLGKIKRGRLSQGAAPIEERRKKSRISGEDD